VQWTNIVPAPPYAWLTDTLEKERGRLAKLSEGVDKKRAAADSLTDLEGDLGRDQSPLLRARIDALESEIAVRDGLIVLDFAIECVAAELQREAKARLLDIEADVREELAISDGIQTPPACLQVRREWWEGRAKLAAIPQFVGHGNRPEHERSIVSAKDTLGKLKAALADEPARLKHIAEAQEREIAFQTSIIERDEKRLRSRDERDERVAALLG